jgi:hypothetical protein
MKKLNPSAQLEVKNYKSSLFKHVALIALFLVTFNLEAQPPIPDLPNGHAENGLLTDPVLVEPNTTGLLWEYQNTTPCNIVELTSHFTVKLDDGTSYNYSIPNNPVSNPSLPGTLDYETLWNTVNQNTGATSFQVTHASMTVSIIVGALTYNYAIFPGVNTTVKTSLPPPCDCLHFTFATYGTQQQPIFKLIISPGFGCE